MIDLPVPVYIEYKNLSSLSVQAEYQKDLMASVIKKIEGPTKLILEQPKNFSHANGQSSSFILWQAKCVLCYNISDNNNSIILSSVKKIVKNNTESSLSFDTIDLMGRISSWKIEIVEVKPILVHSGKDVKINFNSKNNISVQAFGKPLKNGIQGDTIPIQVNNWFIKNNHSHSTEIIEAQVVAPNEVEYVSKQ